MTRLNYECDNTPAPKGRYGGSICMCLKCVEQRTVNAKGIKLLQAQIQGAWSDYLLFQREHETITGNKFRWKR